MKPALKARSLYIFLCLHGTNAPHPGRHMSAVELAQSLWALAVLLRCYPSRPNSDSDTAIQTALTKLTDAAAKNDALARGEAKPFAQRLLGTAHALLAAPPAAAPLHALAARLPPRTVAQGRELLVGAEARRRLPAAFAGHLEQKVCGPLGLRLFPAAGISAFAVPNAGEAEAAAAAPGTLFTLDVRAALARRRGASGGGSAADAESSESLGPPPPGLVLDIATGPDCLRSSGRPRGTCVARRQLLRDQGLRLVTLGGFRGKHR